MLTNMRLSWFEQNRKACIFYWALTALTLVMPVWKTSTDQKSRLVEIVVFFFFGPSFCSGIKSQYFPGSKCNSCETLCIVQQIATWRSDWTNGRGRCLLGCVCAGMLNNQTCMWRSHANSHLGCAFHPLMCHFSDVSIQLVTTHYKEERFSRVASGFRDTQTLYCHLDLHNWILLAAPLNLNPPKLSEVRARESEREYIISAATAAYSLNTECLK